METHFGHRLFCQSASHPDVIAQWVIVYFRQQFEKYRSSPHFWATLFHGTSYVSVLSKKRLGHILGYIFSQTHRVTVPSNANHAI
jgi:hypothetical protein